MELMKEEAALARAPMKEESAARIEAARAAATVVSGGVRVDLKIEESPVSREENKNNKRKRLVVDDSSDSP
jgi:hypothetical protein